MSSRHTSHKLHNYTPKPAFKPQKVSAIYKPNGFRECERRVKQWKNSIEKEENRI